MADEVQEKQQSQKDAEQHNELPDEVRTEVTPIEEYQKENEQAHDKLAEFGETDIEQFILKVTSNSVYARHAIRKLLGLDGDKPSVLKHIPAPQEKNQTGDLDHATWPPKVKGAPDGTKTMDDK